MFSELIDKHGPSDWLDPLMDSLGPYIQLQLGGTPVIRIGSLLNAYLCLKPQPFSESKAFIGFALRFFFLKDAELTTEIADMANMLEVFSKCV